MTDVTGKNLIPWHDQRDNTALARANNRLRLSMRIVAWVFIITGVSSLVNVVLRSVDGGISLDFQVLGIFIGRGLLHRREGWLRFAAGYTVFLLVGTAGLAILALGIYLGELGGFITNVTWSQPPALVFSGFLGFWAYLIWQKRVLTRAWAQDLFRRRADEQPSRTLQFSLGTLLMLVVLTATILSQVTDVDFYDRRLNVLSRNSAGRQWTIYTCYRSHRFLSQPDELGHVIFLSDRQNSRHRVKWRSSAGNSEAILEMPDGSRIAVDDDCQLSEWLDGRFRERREGVTRRQFEAFLASEPATYTIDALLEYVNRHPE